MTKLYIILGAIIIWISQIFASGGERRLADLRGHWKFEIGDNMRWAKPDFDDSNWKTIYAPSEWENEGFPGYDGFAWYRKRFNLPAHQEDHTVYVHIGRIDDADEVYINGYLVGYSGSFPPKYNTAYAVFREYLIPTEFLNFSGENIIAVRVFDEHLEGGIIEGRLGLFEAPNIMPVQLDLSGHWLFQTGDEDDWKMPGIDESRWDTLIVPFKWDIQGYEDYNGFAWYRKTFNLPSRFRNEEIILLLGLIDDLDQTFVNGEKVGETGKFYRYSAGNNMPVDGDEWLELRAYKLPPEILNYGGANLIAVRVYDGLIEGGIYKGPIGITTREYFERSRIVEIKRETNGFWKWLGELLFSPR